MEAHQVIYFPDENCSGSWIDNFNLNHHENRGSNNWGYFKYQCRRYSKFVLERLERSLFRHVHWHIPIRTDHFFFQNLNSRVGESYKKNACFAKRVG